MPRSRRTDGRRPIANRKLKRALRAFVVTAASVVCVFIVSPIVFSVLSGASVADLITSGSLPTGNFCGMLIGATIGFFVILLFDDEG